MTQQYDRQSENKYADPSYRKRVREWARKLKSEDHAQESQQLARDNLKGNLQTGGKGGFAPQIGIDEAADIHEGVTDLDNREII